MVGHQVPLPPDPGASSPPWPEPGDAGVLSDDAMPVDQQLNVQPMPKFRSVRGRVIIIEPVGTEEIKRKFIGKSLAVAKLLNDSSFSNAIIEDVNVNFRNVTISVQVQNENFILNLLEIKFLGIQPIKCYQPNSHWETKGVISGIGTEVTEEEIITAVNEQNEARVSQAIRLNTGKEKRPSVSIKLIFVEGVKKLPENIKIGYQRFPVREFKERLLQCFKCQRFGHSSKRCGAIEKCVFCAGNHRVSECPKQELKCANCEGKHTSSYSKCPRLVEAKIVNEIRVEHKLTYREAILRHKTNVSATAPNPPVVVQDTNWPLLPQVNRQDFNNNNERQPVLEVHTPEHGQLVQKEKQNSLDTEQLCAFIIEMLQALIGRSKEESGQTQGEIVTSVTKKVFGNKVDTEKIIKILREGQNQKRSRTDSEKSETSQTKDDNLETTDSQAIVEATEHQESVTSGKTKKKKKKLNQTKQETWRTKS